LSVGCETEDPPQIQMVTSCPTNGMAVITPVMTVAPQKDIWPHGSTYPKKAVAIVTIRIMTPTIQVSNLEEAEEKKIPRVV